MATLIEDIFQRGLNENVLVIVTGEFGRTPRLEFKDGNVGRDHWPRGFSIALAGGGLHGGQVLGETDPDGIKDPTDPVTVAEVHATVLRAVGIDPNKVMQTPIGRTLHLSEGKRITTLLS